MRLLAGLGSLDSKGFLERADEQVKMLLAQVGRGHVFKRNGEPSEQ
jgi:hypothetical protein